jgi:hypothetical protein
MEKFQDTVIQTMEQIARETGTVVRGEDMLDETWCQRVTKALNIEVAVDELQDVLDQAFQTSLMQTGTTGKALRHKPIPWWTSRLTTQRKEVNTKRRRYQRTKENNERTILSLKSGICRSHQTGRNQIMERVLQCDLCDQPLECSIQDGCREEKNELHT